jgi:phosphopantothenoylcysteine decarboxylase / phosphopantothenate---cysteine ligase
VRVLVTAGPTREPIDPVRYISNRSSGKMGYAIAQAAIEDGHDVTLISGPVCLAPPRGAQVVQITTSDELHDAVHAHVVDCDVLVMCAAVADYKPLHVAAVKQEKQHASWFALQLTATRDILASLPNERRYLVVGFAAQTHALEENALRKLRVKHCDAIVANDVSDSAIGMESDDNAVTIFFRDGSRETLSRAPKIEIARALMKIIARMSQKSLTKKS